MALRGHGTGIAITAAVAALVVASAGSAVAVTSTVVNIADPAVPSRVAHVDAAGKLAVVQSGSAIASSNLASVTNGDNFVTSPTNATLAITKLSFSNPSVNAAASSAEIRYYLYQVGVTGTACSSAASANLLGIYNIAPGDDFEDVFAAPLIIKPVGTAKYCLDLYASPLGGTYTANYFPSYNLAGYAVSGTYTGIGVAPTTTSPQVIAQQEPAAAK